MLKRKAVGMVAETLASSGDVFTRDDDLELVGDAIPFGLKLYESLLDSAPLNARVSATIPTAFRLSGLAHPCRRVNAHTDDGQARAPEGENRSIPNYQLYTGCAHDR